MLLGKIAEGAGSEVPCQRMVRSLAVGAKKGFWMQGGRTK
jgi:hypothetical protein